MTATPSAVKEGAIRTCLHCVLSRALRAETSRLRGHGLEPTVGPARAVLLPVPGREIYRGLRGLLRDAAGAGQGGRLKVTVVDLPGKSHVEVTAVVTGGRGGRVHSRAFPRCVPGSLGLGFAEC